MSLPPPPPGTDLSDDRRAEIIIAAAITWTLAVVSIGLRLVCRHIKGAKLWVDDWLIIASLAACTPQFFALDLYAVTRGFGRHIWSGPPDVLKSWAISVFIAELSYTATMVFVKLSILAFYWRSFGVKKSIKIPIILLAAMTVIWGIGVFLSVLLSCQPTRAWWQRFDPVHPMQASDYTCSVDSPKLYLGNAFFTIITDIMMLGLPIPYIWNLKLPGVQKLVVIGILLVGVFVTIISSLRLQYLFSDFLSNPDITWIFIDIAIWSDVECNIAIVCACLPFLRPILGRLGNALNTNTVQPTKNSDHPGSTSIESISTEEHESGNYHEVETSRQIRRASETNEESLPTNRIVVRSEISMKHEPV